VCLLNRMCAHLCLYVGMPQLSPVDVLPSLGYRIDSQYFQPTFASDSSALEAASLSSVLNYVQQALLERDRQIERQREEIRLLLLERTGPVPLDDQVLMDV
jgi:hypothetical protein